MKAGLLGALAAALVAYLVCALLGAAVKPALGPAMPPAQAAAALSAAFGDEGSDHDAWIEPSGHALHSWFFRRAWVTGRRGLAQSPRYAEQVLKVGWPFTVVRGFVRTAGPQVHAVGALVLSAEGALAPRRLVPLQPVWPGLALSALLGAVVGMAVAKRRRRKQAAAAPGA